MENARSEPKRSHQYHMEAMQKMLDCQCKVQPKCTTVCHEPRLCQLTMTDGFICEKVAVSCPTSAVNAEVLLYDRLTAD